MKRFISYLLMTLAVPLSFLSPTATDLHAQSLSDSLRAAIFRPHFQEDSDSVASVVVTAEGDTLYIYGKKKYDFGAIVNHLQKSDTDGKQLLRAVASISNAAQAPSSPSTQYAVGSIPFTESVSPSGARVYSIPLPSVPLVPLSAQLALAYNSQSGNGVAGYGWNLAGLSCVTLTGQNQYYDGKVRSIDLSNPSSCRFLLDGVRLVDNTGALSATYEYETAQGFILVGKRMAGSEICCFTVAYPNGSKATFGFENNRRTRLSYPITQLTDIDGNTIRYEYVESGNNYYISKITYGTKGLAASLGEITFEYASRTDFTTAYHAGVPLSANLLLKRIAIKNIVNGSAQELYTYVLTHRQATVSLLTQIDCKSGASSLPPLTFAYTEVVTNRPASFRRESDCFLTQYFPEICVSKRGKFIKNQYNDGLVCYPGFHTYDVIATRKKGKVHIPIYGSKFSPDQDILVAPELSFMSDILTIKAEEGFQTIDAVDVDGDGVDELVKVNFDGLDGDNTKLKITVCKTVGKGQTSSSFTIPVRGIVNIAGVKSPLQRFYYFGDFLGTGKVQLLTISSAKDPLGEERPSYFALIDLHGKSKLSEREGFSVGTDYFGDILPVDIDGDGKTELGYLTIGRVDFYEYSGSQFVRRFESSVFKDIDEFPKYAVGDLNGDRKTDFLVMPALSFEGHSVRSLPVWAPRHCPLCHQSEPILDMSDLFCSNCREYLFDHCGMSIPLVCRICNSPLLEQSNNETEPYEKYYCPTHGSVRDITVDLGFVDRGKDWIAYLSTGCDFVKITMPVIRQEHKDDNCMLMDVNNDGNADLLFIHNQTVSVYLNDRGKIDSTAICTLGIAKNTKPLPANVCDGYSMSHFITIEDAQVKCYRFSQDYGKSNLLTTLIDSYGNRHLSEYNDMTDSYGAYIPTSSANVYPYSSFFVPFNLLSRSYAYTADNKRYEQFSYSYYGAVVHRTGLGFCGFEKIKTQNDISQTVSEEFHDPQRFGVTTKTVTPKETVDYWYSFDSFSNKKNNPRLTRLEKMNGLTGILQISAYGYDLYNNPVGEAHIFSDNSPETYVVRNYQNTINSSFYLPGQLMKSEIRKTRGGMSWTTSEVFTYQDYHKPSSKVNYVGDNKESETRWEYDAHGNMISEKSAPYEAQNFVGSTYTYDHSGRYLVSRTNALGQTTSYSNYDKWGNALTITDFKGRKTIGSADAWGKITSTTMPDGVTEATLSAWGGQGLYTVTTTTTGKPSVVTHYDVLDREIRTGTLQADGQWLYINKVYDERGRLEKESLPFKSAAAHWTTYSYDAYDRPLSCTEASGRMTSWSYTNTKVTESKNGVATTKTYNASGALVCVEDPGGTITYDLRPDGQPDKITAPGGVVTSFGYDDYGRKTNLNDPSAGRMEFGYDSTPSGSYFCWSKDANGIVTQIGKDEYGRIRLDGKPEVRTEYFYNTDNQLVLKKSSNGASISYTYDSQGRVLTVKDSMPDRRFLIRTFTYADGNVTSVRYASQNGDIATENFVYVNGHNTEILLNGKSIWKLTKENDMGIPVKSVTGPFERTYGYTEFGQLTGRNAGNFQKQSYRFDTRTVCLTSRKDDRRNLEETFAYDGLNRLTQINHHAVSYAPNGNLTSMGGVGEMKYGNKERPYQLTDFYPVGNATMLREQQVKYTSFLCPAHITENGITASFEYKADDNRMRMTVKNGDATLLTRYYIGDCYEQDVETGVERLYLGGDAYSAPAVYVKERGSWKIYYICRDHLGSITHVVNEDGTVKQELSYDAWGRLRNPETQEAYAPGSEPILFLGRGYTGHEYLPWFGLVNMNARLYDPVLGRFLSPDPYVQMPDDTQSYNRYSYCMNNPLKYVDKNGKSFLLIAAAFIGAYIGGVASNKGELNPCAWNWREETTYLGLGFGAILGYTCCYGFLHPGTIGFTFGVNNSWGGVGLTVGGAGCLSHWDFRWSTITGSGGNIPLKNDSYEKNKRQADSRFFHGSLYEALRLLVYLSKMNGVEMATYKTDYGFYFDQKEGYVFSSSEIHNERYKLIGKRYDGDYIYYASNTKGAGTLYSIRTRRDGRPYLDLGLDWKFDVREMYHTHPNNTNLSPSDPFQGIIPTYAVGWDGIRRGPVTISELDGSILLDGVEIVRPAVKIP